MHDARGKISDQPPCGVGLVGVAAGAGCDCSGWAGTDCVRGTGTACGSGFTPGATCTAGALESAFGTDITPRSCSDAAFGLALWVAFHAMNKATPKNTIPSHLVDFDDGTRRIRTDVTGLQVIDVGRGAAPFIASDRYCVTVTLVVQTGTDPRSDDETTFGKVESNEVCAMGDGSPAVGG